jgi:TatA/E family protein of Tat protein translocase
MPIHPLWIVAILVIVLIIFGPGRLPELGSAAGKAMREFRKATSELSESVSSSVQTTPAAPPAAPVAPPAASAVSSSDDAAAAGTESISSSKN